MNNDRLQNDLKQAAESHSPAFSPLLHARTLQRIHAPFATPVPLPRPLPLHRYLAAAAALLLLAGGVWLTLQPGNSLPTNTLSSTTPREIPLPSVADLFEKATAPAQSKFDEGRLAYLDRDAQRFADFVLDRLPVASSK